MNANVLQRLYLIFVAILAFAPGTQSAEGENLLLPFQGRLTDRIGNSLSDGAYLVRFRIFNSPGIANPVWEGEIHRATVNSGLINVILGTKSSLTNIDFNQAHFLEITLDSNGQNGQPDNQITEADTPMSPRHAILPVIFAKASADSRLLEGHSWKAILNDNSPVTGTILPSKFGEASIDATRIVPGTITSNQIAVSGVQAINIADGAVTKAKLAPVNIAMSETVSFACNQSEGCAGEVEVPDLQVTLTTSGRPVFLGLVGGTGDNSYIWLDYGNPDVGGSVLIFEGTKAIASFFMENANAIPSSSIHHIYIPSAGQHAFKIKLSRRFGAQMRVDNVRFVAYEL